MGLVSLSENVGPDLSEHLDLDLGFSLLAVLGLGLSSELGSEDLDMCNDINEIKNQKCQKQHTKYLFFFSTLSFFILRIQIFGKLRIQVLKICVIFSVFIKLQFKF